MLRGMANKKKLTKYRKSGRLNKDECESQEKLSDRILFSHTGHSSGKQGL